MPSAQAAAGLVNSWRTVARTTIPVTRISTSVLSTGAGTSGPSAAVRQSRVPSVTRRAPTPASAFGPSALATAGDIRAQSRITSIQSLLVDLMGLASLAGHGRDVAVSEWPDGRGGGGEPAHLDVHAPVELQALPGGLVAERRVRSERDRLHRGFRDPELDEKLLDRLRPALGQRLAVLGRPLAVGKALDQHPPGARPIHEGRVLLEDADGLGLEADALEVEIDVSVNGLAGDGRCGHDPGPCRRLGRGRRGGVDVGL